MIVVLLVMVPVRWVLVVVVVAVEGCSWRW